jgi:hypothetical protein
VPTGTSKTIVVTLTSVATHTENYNLTTLYTGAGFLPTQTTTLPGFTVNPASVTLAAGASAVFTVTFNSTAGRGMGDNQGYVVLTGGSHSAHLPAWARVTLAAPLADILIIDNDGSSSVGQTDYVGYYTRTLTALGYTYTVLDVDDMAGSVSTFLNTIDLLPYKAILYFTGNYYQRDGTFTVPTPLRASDMNRLTEYANSGGTVIAMGQDVSSVLYSTSGSTASFFYASVLGGRYLRDSVSGNAPPTLPIIPTGNAPTAFSGLSLNLKAPVAYTGAAVLSGLTEVPSVTTTMTGSGAFTYDVATRLLNYTVVVSQSLPYTITAMHIQSGTVGVNGSVLYTLLSTDTPVAANPYTLAGSLVVNSTDVSRLLAGNTYVNIDTDEYTDGEARGQILMTPTTDGAGNQRYIDEIGPMPSTPAGQDPTSPEFPNYRSLLRYAGTAGQLEGNNVAMAHREQPTLEKAGISYLGRSIYASFGLEGVNNVAGSTSRETLLGAFLNWAWEQPSVTIAQTTVPTNSSQLSTFTATFSSTVAGITGVGYRWDFGDGTAYQNTGGSKVAGHTYAICGNYTVRVEAVDSYGNYAVGSQPVAITRCGTFKTYLPLIFR